jgi:uncharacterized protein HemX
MFCTHCGKHLEPEVRFCPDCGTPQGAQPSPAQRRTHTPAPAASAIAATPAQGAFAGKGGKAALWGGAILLILGLVGGGAYWGWSSKVPSEESTRELVADEQARKTAADEAARNLAETRQQQAAAEKAAESAEIAAAHALLDKHIAAEEALALANSQLSAPKASRTAAR